MKKQGCREVKGMSKKEIYNNFYDEFYKDYHLIISKELKKMEQYRKFLLPSIIK